MKKRVKRALSLALAFVLVLTNFSFTLTSFGANQPYIDDDGNFVRLCDGQWVTFNTNYDEIRDEIKSTLMQRKTCSSSTGDELVLHFATSYEENPDLYISFSSDSTNGVENCRNKFLNKLWFDVFLDDDPSDPYDGEYLYYSIISASFDASMRPTSEDIITTKDATGISVTKHYVNYEITLKNVEYYLNAEQEAQTQDLINRIQKAFDMDNRETKYDKLKIIYDYVVRNIEYDNDVFTGKYDRKSQRYKFSHSALGAIMGNVFVKDSLTAYNWTTEDFVLKQDIISDADQGLAVCEGISMLFYVLCQINDIPCKIVRGDYTATSGKVSDPHEWVEIYADDGVKEDHERWYLVDATFAIQKSIKAVHYNNYDYFLKGSSSYYFSDKEHQQATAFVDYFSSTQNPVLSKPMLYDFYSEKAFKPSIEDYEFTRIILSNYINQNLPVLIERSYTYNGKEYGSYLLTESGQEGGTKHYTKIEFDEDGNITRGEDAEGFAYNGQSTTYAYWIPYIIGTNNLTPVIVDEKGNKVDPINAGTYRIKVEGTDASYYFTFDIAPRDMTSNFSNGEFDNDKYNENSKIDWQAGYTGNAVSPEATIIDGFNYRLIEGKDYDIEYYDSQHKNKLSGAPKDIGVYYYDIIYKGNYCGDCSIKFEIGKIDLKEITCPSLSWQYVPKKVLNRSGITTPAEKVLKTAADPNVHIGDYTAVANKDFSYSSTGDLSYNATGTITLTGLAQSEIILAGTKTTYKYSVNKKFDISIYDGKCADNTEHPYTGSAVKPTSLNILEQDLQAGVDYKIVSYRNNINVGKAYVTIEGIGGCSGTIEMYFYVTSAGSSVGGTTDTRKSISKATISYSNTNNTFKYSLKYGSTVLVKNKDYTEKVTVTSGKTTITCTGINNYKGTYTINLGTSLVAPSSSGNYITVSNATYTGKALKPTVKLYNSSKKLVNNFFISSTAYSNNTNVGVGKVTVKTKTGKSATKSFTITPVKTSISSITAGKKAFTVKWAKKTAQVTGYEIQYSTSSKFTSPKAIVVSKNTTVSYTKKSLLAKKKYYVRIRTYKTVGSKKYYSAWSGAKYVTTK